MLIINTTICLNCQVRCEYFGLVTAGERVINHRVLKTVGVICVEVHIYLLSLYCSLVVQLGTLYYR